METAQKWLDQLLAMGPEMLLFVFLIGLGYFLKVVPFFDNKFIPAVNAGVAVIIYPLLCQPGKAPPWVPYPLVYFIVLGFIIFMASWLLHNKLLSLIEEKLGWFDGKKPDEKTPPPPAPPAA